MNLQERIFELILSRHVSRSEAVDHLCQLMNLSKDAVYRRIRCDTVLSPDELADLVTHYRFSVDAIISGQSNAVISTFSAFSKKVNNFFDYLEGVNQDLEQIRKLPNAYLHYTSSELPVFTYNFFPELMGFKLYVWGRITWDLPYLRDRPFDFELISPPIIREMETLLQHYLHLPSTELWSLHIMDNTLAQIEYHLYSGGFRNPSDTLLLCDKLAIWIEHNKLMAASGKKFSLNTGPSEKSGEFELYHNEMVYNNITAMITSDVRQFVYAAYCNPNFLRSDNPQICQYTETWFKNVIAKSTPISRSSEKNRELFFRELARRLEKVRQRLILFIEN